MPKAALKFLNSKYSCSILGVDMSHTKSRRKTIGSSMGVIDYQVVRDKDGVGIQISNRSREILVAQGADLEPLKNIGSRSARKVIKQLIKSSQQTN